MKWMKEHLGETAYRAIRTCIQVAAGVAAAGLVQTLSAYDINDPLLALIVTAVATGLAAGMNAVSKAE